MKKYIQKILLKIISRKIISMSFKFITTIEYPKIFVKIQIYIFIYIFKVNMSEVKKSINEFSSLQDFFIRELKINLRKIDKSKNSLISPCDGFWGQSGKIIKEKLLQVKGSEYKLSSILSDTDMAKKFKNGSFVTFYLSPGNYHRFHMPIDGKILKIIHIPGQLWPVNSIGIRNIANLFCMNERVIILIEDPINYNGIIALIAVGATFVGGIKINFNDKLTINKFNNKCDYTYNSNSKIYNKGIELGRFEFGSTIVMISSENFLKLYTEKNGTAVKVGSKIGIIR